MPQLPQQFLDSIAQAPGLNLQSFIEIHNTEEKLTSIRLNPFKPAQLQFEILKEVPWHRGAFYLRERPVFTLDPLFHAGCYYVQEAGSMFLAQAFNQVKAAIPIKAVLDVCAAPGGKSTLLSSLLDEDALLVSNEIIKNRSITLATNLSKWGKSNAVVTNQDVSKLKPALPLFDFVVVDAPCSGSGLFRKQPEAINEWYQGVEVACAIRQKEILETIVPAMKDGAHLFYSTCSYAKAENEEIVTWLINTFELEYVPITCEKSWSIVDSGLGYRFYPDQVESEGFFCALLRKNTESDQPLIKKTTSSMQVLTREEQNVVSDFLDLNNLSVAKKNGFIYQFSPAVKQFVDQFEKQLYFRKAGTCVGEIKGKDLIPNHELALCTDISTHCESCELSKEEAIKYLRKDALPTLPAQKGFVKITFQSHGLGWAKLLQNRVNNYLPNEARILMQA